MTQYRCSSNSTLQSLPGVTKLKDRQNPATWMLEVSSPTVEAQHDVDFAAIYAKSELYRYVIYLNSILDHVSFDHITYDLHQGPRTCILQQNTLNRCLHNSTPVYGNNACRIGDIHSTMLFGS